MILLVFFINTVNATENLNKTCEMTELNNLPADNPTDILMSTSEDLENRINNAANGDTIFIEPGKYKLHNVQLTKNITFQGEGNPREIIFDAEKKSSIFLIKSPGVHVTFKNITFINGQTDNFGGAICSETGHITVDNCIFINNTALDDTNAGGISNYGTRNNRGYLFVNNSIFIGNHADHDGGAITTCYADSYIHNCVFINNSAVRDGGAIRVSLFGYAYVEDCIFMFNHANEWGGAYYSWSGESDIRRCIFMNNTAGTNGGAVMVSGNLNLQDSIIVNNNGGETGGSFYIQQPMYDTKTVINVHNNIITNNTSPYGKEIFIKWQDSYNLYTQFDNNDWGDENPNDSSINDPNNVTSRSKVSKTIKSDLFGRLNVDLLDKYNDLLKDFFTDDSMDNLKNRFYKIKNNTFENSENEKTPENNFKNHITSKSESNKEISDSNPSVKTDNNQKFVNSKSSKQKIVGNSTSHGEDKKAYELNKSEGGSAIKQINLKIEIFITIVIVIALMAIGYKKEKKKSK